jgi:hypothetical protein
VSNSINLPLTSADIIKKLNALHEPRMRLTSSSTPYSSHRQKDNDLSARITDGNVPPGRV